MAVKFDRSKFQPTKADDAKSKEKKAGLKMLRGSGERTNYHSIDQGDNKFRIYPFHPDGGGDTYFEFKVVNFLPIEVKKYDEQGDLIEGETEIKRKPVFNAKIHGGYELDLVEEYVNLAKKKSETMEDDEKRKYLDKLYHWQKGLKTNRSWVMYADKYIDEKPIFGILEVGNMLKKEINKCASLEDEESAINNDPFTHPDEGICLVINKSGKKLDTQYNCSLEQTRKGKFSFELLPTPLTDEQLEKYLAQEPLYKLYKNTFKRSDFEKQVEGLQRVDEEEELGIFDTEEFMEIMEAISDVIPEDKKEEEETEPKQEKRKPETKTEPKKSTKKVETESEPEDEEEKANEVEQKPVQIDNKKELSAKERIEEIKRKLAAKK